MSTPAPVAAPKVALLDRLPAFARHLLLVLVASAVSAVAADYQSWHLPAAVAALVGPVLTLVATYVTPLTRQYGVGSSKPA